MANVHGIWVNRLQDGRIDSVQVEDNAGQSWVLDAAEYDRRGWQPPKEQLPDGDEYIRRRNQQQP
jgi:hypothetical protein